VVDGEYCSAYHHLLKKNSIHYFLGKKTESIEMPIYCFTSLYSAEEYKDHIKYYTGITYKSEILECEGIVSPLNDRVKYNLFVTYAFAIDYFWEHIDDMINLCNDSLHRPSQYSKHFINTILISELIPLNVLTT
jgi:hypothetical protein